MTLGFLGFGNMAEAIFRGLLSAGAYAPSSIYVFDVDENKVKKATEAGAHGASDAGILAASCDIVLLATKPQDLGSAIEDLKAGFRAETLVISIAAGISTGFIEDRLGPETRVIRVMPNTPALVGAGAAGVAANGNATGADVDVACKIFDAVGITERVDESEMDLITALIGSAPAYFFYFVEAMSKAARDSGMSAEMAERLAGQALYGAGRLLHESEDTAAALRERVTSKGGTTFAAIESFRAKDLEGLVAAAMDAAAKRSKELGG